VNQLSAISKIFDSLELLSPCVIVAKIMLQEPLTDKIAKKWEEFKSKLSLA